MRCRKCHYDVRDLPEPRCPECGTTFDPADPATFIEDAPPSRYCRQCHYYIAGMDGRVCPECGTDYDPGDPATYFETLPSSRPQSVDAIRRRRSMIFVVAAIATIIVVDWLLRIRTRKPKP